ncbi:MAG: CHAT domain-containing protein [Deltaproteobacteria bacterium]|nr:CHAT domain-containing protein [Deltaproteobacteria bacterium]
MSGARELESSNTSPGTSSCTNTELQSFRHRTNGWTLNVIRSLYLLLIGGCAIFRSDVPYVPSEPPEGGAGIRRPEDVAFFPGDELTPSTSRDGRYVAFVSSETGNLDVWVRDFRTDATFPITDDPGDDYDPAFSPDGMTVAFTSRRHDAKGDLFLGSVEGGAERLTDDAAAERQPIYSPDGRRIYYTRSTPLGLEMIAELDLESRTTRTVSPTPGFDPAPSDDGRFLVYTAPSGTGGRTHPHLVLLELASGSTRAITRGDDPAGFARFSDRPRKAGYLSLVYVRFADDDDESGETDAKDQASLWRIELDPADPSSASQPEPLTAGNGDELFPDPRGAWLYFTATTELGQNVVRLPIEGMFPALADPAGYVELGRSLTNRREAWFATRVALARTKPKELTHARALLDAANLLLEQKRLRLARAAFSELVESTEGVPPESKIGTLGGIARVETASLDRQLELLEAKTSRQRERASRRVEGALDEITRRYASARRVVARVDLERAEVLVDRGLRSRAIEAFDEVAREHADVPYSAARAMIRRTELLAAAFDPETLGLAYERVIEKFPGERQWVQRAAERLVEVSMEAERRLLEPQTDTLRRVAMRSRSSIVRSVVRRRIAASFERDGRLDEACAELRSLAAEAAAAEDRASASAALLELARLEESLGAFDRANDVYRGLLDGYADLPGVTDLARSAITRVNTSKATLEERRGAKEAARESFKTVLANDFNQVRAHRRYVALSAMTGHAEEVLEETRQVAATRDRSPVAHLAYAIALTWQSPPALDEALDEAETALAINPQFVGAYIARGWIQEMMDLDDSSGDHLERAIEDYQVAARLNPEASDRVTEAEILLDLSNARWRLASKTHDATNFRSAFQDYMERLRARVPFETPESELVFLERLGRAAIWDGEFAVSAMATREALRLADDTGRVDRMAQLYGNLALAYSQAGEDEYAGEAFEHFAQELERLKQNDRLAIARRNRAITALSAAEATGAGSVRAALEELAKARAEARESGVRVTIPGSVFSQVPNASRAPFGFGEEMERDVNLAWAERGHELLEEASRADGLREERTRLVESLANGLKPIPLGVFREWLGLRLGRARERCRGGDVAACLEGFSQTASQIAEWLEAGKTDEKDAVFILADRARLEALRGEELALWVSRSDVRPLLPGLLEAVGAALSETSKMLDSIPEAETASSAYELDEDLASTISEDKASSRGFLLPLAVKDLLAARARAFHARGSLRLAAAFDPAPGPEASLEERLSDLDGSIASLEQARQDFVRGRRVALASTDESSRELVFAAADGLLAVAESGLGEAELPRSELTLARGRDSYEALLRRRASVYELDEVVATLTSSLARIPAISARSEFAELLLARSASVSLSKDELGAAFDALDRAQLYRNIAGRGLPRSAWSQTDRALLKSLMAARRSAESARRVFHRLSVDADPDERRAKLAWLDAAEKKLASFRAARGSDAVKARVFAEPIGVDLFELDPDEALLVLAPREGVLELFLVDGSTLAETPLVHRTCELSVREVASLVSRARSSLEAGRSPNVSARLLAAALLDPFEERLRTRRTLVMADAAVGGPIPAYTFDQYPKLAFVHVGAPTSFAVARATRFAATSRSLVIRAHGDESKLPDRSLLVGAEALAILGTEKSRKSVEAPSGLMDRSLSTLSVEAPLYLERGAPERSAIRLVDWDKRQAADRGPEDDFIRELPLDELRIPARLVIFEDVRGPISPAMDLGLSLLGFPSAVLMPAEVPLDVRRRVSSALRKEAEELGPARALANALRVELVATPSAGLITLIGSAGVDAKGARVLAEREVASRAVINTLKAQAFEDGALLLLRRFDGQLQTKSTEKLEATCSALFNVLTGKLGDFARGAESQTECLAALEAAGARPGELAATRLRLAETYSKAKAFETASKLYAEAITRYESLGDALELSRARLALADHYKQMSAYKEQAETIESVVSDSKQFGALLTKDPDAALSALRTLGSVYLKRLSDTESARRAYQRLFDFAKKPSDRVSASIDLARVARQAGEFDEALERAENARAQAVRIKRKSLQLAAIVEAANVAWYQGDYARGHALCREGDALANTILATSRKSTKPTRAKNIKRAKKDLIYVLSVCGLLHMSTRDFESGKSVLERAKAVAFAIDDEAEVAAQLNNLGRLYLEFNRLDEAIEAFSGAQEIDERLDHKYGIAYDLRNLGDALSAKGKSADAEKSLLRALELTREVKDSNNELRALFSLGELMRRKGQIERATGYYELALPLAERFEVKELAWQILEARGLIALAAKDLPAAELAFRSSISVVRTMSGRAVASGAGPNRLSPFENLATVQLERGQIESALELLEEARRLAEIVALDDRRIQWPSKSVPSLLRQLREAGTATTTRAVLTELEGVDPRLSDALTLEPIKDLVRRIPEDSAVVVPRATRDAVLLFVVQRSGVSFAGSPRTGVEVTELVKTVANRMLLRAEVDAPLRALSETLLGPIAEQLKDKARVAFVPTGALRYVPFAALPYSPTKTSSTTLLVDHMSSILSLSLRDGVRALGAENVSLLERGIVAIGAAGDGVLPFANKEVELIREEYPASTLKMAAEATKESWLSSLSRFEGVLHFAGHTRLSEADPLGGTLAFVDGALALHEIIGRRIEASLVILSGCETWAASAERGWSVSGEELASLAEALRVGGARAIVATQGRVDDVAAAVLMKQMYRAARRRGPAEALRAAQQAVRKRLPHPAWWATFSFVGS